MPTLTVLGGYLGSGKTTLLNGVLTGDHGLRIAVVVNDFGAVNVDAELVARSSGPVMEFANGCICCQLRDDAIPVMTSLAAREDLDHVIVELSGVALPSSFTAWGHVPGMSAGPSVVCADALTITRKVRDEFVGDVVREQLGQADAVVLTRADTTKDARFEDALRTLQRLVPAAPILPSGGGDLALVEILRRAGTAPLSTQSIFRTDPELDVGKAGSADSAQLSGGAAHGDERFTSRILMAGAVRDPSAVARMIEIEILPFLERIKGFVLDTEGRVWVLQGAGEGCRAEPYIPATEKEQDRRAEPTKTRLVLIAARRSRDGEQMLAKAIVRLAQLIPNAVEE